MDIILDSGVLEVTKIIKRSRAKMFKKLRIGDKIRISTNTHFSFGKKNLSIVNLQTGETVEKTFNELYNILGLFELTKVEDPGDARHL